MLAKTTSFKKRVIKQIIECRFALLKFKQREKKMNQNESYSLVAFSSMSSDCLVPVADMELYPHSIMHAIFCVSVSIDHSSLDILILIRDASYLHITQMILLPCPPEL